MRKTPIVVLVALVTCTPEMDGSGGTVSTSSETTSAPPTDTGDASTGTSGVTLGPAPHTTTTSGIADVTGESSGTTGPAPFCGDGTIDPGEECEVGDHGCIVSTCTRQLQVFVTHTDHLAVEFGGGVGGLAGADALCQEQAEDADQPGRYKAWLSTPLSWPARRFVSAPGVSYILWHKGEIVAPTWEALLAGEGNFGIDEDAGGDLPWEDDVFAEVWTGTGPDGRVAGSGTCQGWTGTSGSAVRGLVHFTAAPEWTWWSPDPELHPIEAACRGTRLPIYCFRQAPDPTCEGRARLAGRAACEDAGLASNCFDFTVENSGPAVACAGMATVCDSAGVPCPVTRELCAEVETECG